MHKDPRQHNPPKNVKAIFICSPHTHTHTHMHLQIYRLKRYLWKQDRKPEKFKPVKKPSASLVKQAGRQGCAEISIEVWPRASWTLAPVGLWPVNRKIASAASNLLLHHTVYLCICICVFVYFCIFVFLMTGEQEDCIGCFHPSTSASMPHTVDGARWNSFSWNISKRAKLLVAANWSWFMNIEMDWSNPVFGRDFSAAIVVTNMCYISKLLFVHHCIGIVDQRISIRIFICWHLCVNREIQKTVSESVIDSFGDRYHISELVLKGPLQIFNKMDAMNS